VLRVSTSGYYASLDRTPSRRAQRHERIQQAVQQVHAESYGIYGSRKIAEMLEERDDLESGCRNTVATAMREFGPGQQCRQSLQADHDAGRPNETAC